MPHMPKIDLQNLQKIEDDRSAEALAKVLMRLRKVRDITRDGLASSSVSTRTPSTVSWQFLVKKGPLKFTSVNIIPFVMRGNVLAVRIMGSGGGRAKHTHHNHFRSILVNGFSLIFYANHLQYFLRCSRHFIAKL